jgi:hypothetical protein
VAAAAGSRRRGRERKRLGFGDEIQRLWFVARISMEILEVTTSASPWTGTSLTTKRITPENLGINPGNCASTRI